MSASLCYDDNISKYNGDATVAMTRMIMTQILLAIRIVVNMLIAVIRLRARAIASINLVLWSFFVLLSSLLPLSISALLFCFLWLV